MNLQISLFDTETKQVEPKQVKKDTPYRKFIRGMIKEGYKMTLKKKDGCIVQTFKRRK